MQSHKDEYKKLENSINIVDKDSSTLHSMLNNYLVIKEGFVLDYQTHKKTDIPWYHQKDLTEGETSMTFDDKLNALKRAKGLGIGKNNPELKATMNKMEEKLEETIKELKRLRLGNSKEAWIEREAINPEIIQNIHNSNVKTLGLDQRQKIGAFVIKETSAEEKQEKNSAPQASKPKGGLFGHANKEKEKEESPSFVSRIFGRR